MKKVLVLASGFSANQIKEYNYKANGWIIVSVNNGWLAAPQLWDYWIRANDYKGAEPKERQLLTGQEIVKAYGPSLKKFGGQKACGYSIALNAGYWCLDYLKPDVVAFLGADMNYTPNEKGHTHIYGKGNDIKKKGIPDPDRMVKVHGDGKPNFLERLYKRFETESNKVGCKVYNVSHTIETRLPYQRTDPKNL